MATLTQSGSRRKYSWWWDSHISPKNSKWLKENLTDMDSKIKSMIKIIEEDADSFARRAEMYYRRRPELMSLVEEIYRAYRALAERYDHATGALRQAHRTMAEAFPDQVPLDFNDDDDVDDYVGDDADDGDDAPHFFNPADLQKQIKDFDVLRKEIMRLSQENEDLRDQVERTQPEARNLKEVLLKLEAEKEAALLQSKESSDRLNSLKSEISRTQEEFNRLKEEMQVKLHSLSTAQERCEALQRTNQSLESELERFKLRAREKEEEVEKLNISLQSEQIQKMQSEMARISLEKKLKEACERIKGLAKMEKEMERIKEGRRKLEDQNRLANSVVSRLQDEIKNGGERWYELERRNESLSFELERMKQRHKASEEKVNTLEAEIEKVKEEKWSLSTTLEDEEERYSALERVNNSLSSELEMAKQRLTEFEEEAKMEIEKLNFSLQEVQLQKMKSEMVKSSLEKALEECQERTEALSEENEILQGEIEKMKEDHRALSSSLKTGEERYKSLEGRNRSLSQELEELKRRRLEVERTRSHLQEVKFHKVQIEMEKIELEREMEMSKEEYATLNLSFEEKEKELNEKVGELKRLQVQLQEMHSQKMQEQMIHSSTEKQLAEKMRELERLQAQLQDVHLEKSQERSVHLLFEKQLAESHERLDRLYLQKEKLETEMDRIREENKSLDEQNHLANSRIIRLQDEIISLHDLKRRLEDQIALHLGEKRLAQEELSRIKHERSEQESRHFSLTEQIQTVNSNVDSLQGLVQELKDGNFELKEIIKNHEDVRTLQSENLRQLERMSEKNTLLEKSLSIANAELEGLRREKEELELSSETLHSNIEKLVWRKNLLENSLCDANAEIEGLRGKFKELNTSYQLLMGEKEKLEAEKGTLMSEVHSIKAIFAELEKRYQELQIGHRNLYQDKAYLEDKLNQEKVETEKTKELLEAEQQRVVKTQNEIFKFQRSLNEANEMISKLHLVRKDRERLVQGIRSLQDLLKLDKKYNSFGELQEEIIIQLILHEVGMLINTVSEAQDARQSRLVEKSLVVTLLEHFGKEVHELRVERESIKQENTAQAKELHELRGEVEFLVSQVTDMQDSRRSLQKEIVTLFEENSHLSQKQKASQADLNAVLTESISQDIIGVAMKVVCEEICAENISLKKCGYEIENLMGNIKSAIFDAAYFKEKVLELTMTCESFEIGAMVQREVLKEEISRRNLYVHELKEKLNEIEVENRRLKVDLDKGEMMILGSLNDEVAALEQQTLSLTKDRLRVSKNRKEEKKMASSKRTKSPLKPTKENPGYAAAPVTHNAELQQLYTTIKSLQKVVSKTALALEQERVEFAASLADAKKQVELLKMKEISDDDYSRVNYEQMLKDIQLDLVQSPNSSSSFNSRGERDRLKVHSLRQKNMRLNASGSTASGNSGSFNSESWGIAGEERDNSERRKLNVRSLMQRDIELEYPEIEPVVDRERDMRGKRLSTDQMSEKELGVDKQMVPRKVGTTESHQEWKMNIIERLSSDSRRLSELQSGLNELKSNIGLSEENNGRFTSQEMENITVQLREAEGTIVQLIETNNKLSKKVDEVDSNVEGESGSDAICKTQKKISERARKTSEKIVRLELELQKVQSILLKLEVDKASGNTASGVRKRSKVLLVEYLYGKRKDSRRQRKTPRCGCMRTKTQE